MACNAFGSNAVGLDCLLFGKGRLMILVGFVVVTSVIVWRVWSLSVFGLDYLLLVSAVTVSSERKGWNEC